MKRFTMLVILSTLALSACGSEVKDDVYTAECKKIGHIGDAAIKQCAKDSRRIEKEFSEMKEPTTKDIEKEYDLEPGSLSSNTKKEKVR